MDQKQFNEFQTAIQFVVDEKRRRDNGEGWRDTVLEHRQEFWGIGKTLPGIISAKVQTQFTGLSRHESDWHPVCASGCCVAGNIVLAHGDQFVVPAWNVDSGVMCQVEECLDDDGIVHRIGSRAMELAGIDEREANRLFHQHNEPQTIVDLATMIAAEHGFTLQVI